VIKGWSCQPHLPVAQGVGMDQHWGSGSMRHAWGI